MRLELPPEKDRDSKLVDHFFTALVIGLTIAFALIVFYPWGE